jgi:serine/threonine protein kinase
MKRKKLVEGEVLRERYQIAAALSEGSYGVVYAADDIVIKGARWAIKEIWEGTFTDDDGKETVELFAREGEFLRNLNHTGVPKVIDIFSISDCHYIVMEYVNGETLEVKRDHSTSVAEVLAWGIRLCDILEYLHRQAPPVIFRDLKPSNIMVTPRGRVVLIDFGIARFFNPLKVKDTFVLGTPGFSPPEQYGKGQSDARNDVYSLSATLYYVLSGQDMAQFGFSVPPLSRFRCDVPRGIEQVLARGLEQEPGRRYESVEALRKALQQVATGAWKKPAPAASSRQGAHASAGKALPSIAWLWCIFLLLWAASSVLPISPVLHVVPFCIIPLYIIAGFFHVPTRQDRAFGLIVSTVIIIIMMVVVPRLYMARLDGRYTHCMSNLKNMGTALEMYSTDHGGLYPSSLTLLVPRYIDELPTCSLSTCDEHGEMCFPEPWWKKPRTPSYSYEVNSWCDNYTISCIAGVHEISCSGPGFPRYNADIGLLDGNHDFLNTGDNDNFSNTVILASCRQHITTLSKALNSYAHDHQGSYPSELMELVPCYLHYIPVCPSPWVRGFFYSYSTAEGAKRCHLSCSEGVHRAASGKKVYPRFDSDRGISE